MPGPRVYAGTLFMVCSVGRGLDPSAGTWRLPQPVRSGQDPSLQTAAYMPTSAACRRLYHKKRLPHKVKPHAAASRCNPFPGKNIEILLVTFLIRKVTYFSMTSFVSRAIISSSLVSMISVRTRAPQAVTSTTSSFCLCASRFLSVSMRMPSQSM